MHECMMPRECPFEYQHKRRIPNRHQCKDHSQHRYPERATEVREHFIKENEELRGKLEKFVETYEARHMRATKISMRASRRRWSWRSVDPSAR